MTAGTLGSRIKIFQNGPTNATASRRNPCLRKDCVTLQPKSYRSGKLCSALRSDPDSTAAKALMQALFSGLAEADNQANIQTSNNESRQPGAISQTPLR
jgi:hypothetical protein